MTVSIKDWIGNSAERTDVVRADPFIRLALSLGLPLPNLDVGAPLPPLWHWLLFPQRTSRSRTGTDGHPVRGDFLPPVQLKRRMFAGGRMHFHSPIRVGMETTQMGTIVELEEKHGRSGPLTIVTVRYELWSGKNKLLTEEQDLVYTDAEPTKRSPTADSRPPSTPWTAHVSTDEILLFRFSALTFNAHRIHYDRHYATTQEGYPELVVQGPMTAMLLAELVRDNTEGSMRDFSFRARAPLYVGDVIHLCGSPGPESIQLAAYDRSGVMAMEAEARTE